MVIVLEVIDKTGRAIHLSKERLTHIQKHPHMHNQLENIRWTLMQPTIIRCVESDKSVRQYYKEFKERHYAERYLFVAVKYLNGKGFIITAFFTNRITGLK